MIRFSRAQRQKSQKRHTVLYERPDERSDESLDLSQLHVPVEGDDLRPQRRRAGLDELLCSEKQPKQDRVSLAH